MVPSRVPAALPVLSEPIPGVVLVGTAHVSKASVEEVRATINERKPDVVAVELDATRHKVLTDKKRWEATPVTELLKGGRAFMVLAQALLAAQQRRLGAEQGIEPGAEMVAGIEEAGASGATVVLADRDITVTLRRAWALMGFREKVRLAWEFLKASVGLGHDEGPVEVEELLHEDVLTAMMEDLARMAPSVAQVLIHERDAYLAQRILDARAQGTVVAVVGAGHLKGITRHLQEPAGIPKLASLEVVPEKRIKWGKILGWGIILFLATFLALFSLQFAIRGDYVGLLKFLGLFLLFTGTPSAIGVALAGAHPASIVAAFFGAPVAILHPAIATGWIAGYVEARIRSPTVKDFQEVTKMETLGQFWRNGVTRLLLVAALGNVGAMIGVSIAVSYFGFQVVKLDWALLWGFFTGWL